MIDVCFYLGLTPPEVYGNECLNDLLINYKSVVTSIDGFLDGESDIYYCEFCQHCECLYHSFINLN